MCTSPRLIKNRSYVAKPGSKKMLSVPCGCCDDCRNNKINDWLVRITYEMNLYNHSGGRVIFTTLTYQDLYIPRYRHPESGEYFLCFNKADTTRFIKRLRDYFASKGFKPKRLKRDGSVMYDDFNSDLNIKYMMCAEYGSGKTYEAKPNVFKTATFRPHFHILLFLPHWIIERFKEHELMRIIEACWTRPYTEKEKRKFKSVDSLLKFYSIFTRLGMVRWSTYDDGRIRLFVASDFALRYAVKYTVKDLDFYDNPKVRDLINNTLKSDRGAFSSLIPKHYQSKNIGASLVPELRQNPELFIDGIDLHHQSQIEKGKIFRYSVPRVLADKVCLEKSYVGKVLTSPRTNKRIHKPYQDYFVSFPSPFGLHVKQLKFEDFILNAGTNLAKCINLNHLQFVLHDDNTCKEVTGFSSIKLLHSHMYELLKSRPMLELALFNKLYYGRLCRPNFIKKLDKLSSDGFLDFSRKLYFDDIYHELDIKVLFADDDKIINKPIFESKVFRNGYTYSHNANRFLGFAELSELINQVNNYYRASCHKAYLVERDKQKYIKDEIQKHKRLPK